MHLGGDRSRRGRERGGREQKGREGRRKWGRDAKRKTSGEENRKDVRVPGGTASKEVKSSLAQVQNSFPSLY